MSRFILFLLVSFGGALSSARLTAAEAIPVQRTARANPVDFRREVLPFLQASCLPCHNRTTTKADLILETTADMLKGGENGPAIVVGKSADSLLLKLSTHAEKPRMPPRDNKVNAPDLTPQQLGLLAQWIDEGAKDGGGGPEVIPWLASAPELQAIYAAAISGDGQFVVCGRGNRLYVYHRPTAQYVAELSDPSLTAGNRRPPAHQDIVGALAFRPDGGQIASGSFREVKLWRRLDSAFQPVSEFVPGTNAWAAVTRSADGSRVIRTATNGLVELADGDGKVVAVLHGDSRVEQDRRDRDRERTAARSVAAVVEKRLDAAAKELKSQEERLGRARESMGKASDAVGEREKARDKANEDLSQSNDVVQKLAKDAKEEDRKAANQKVENAKKAADEAEGTLKEAVRKRTVSEDELKLAGTALERSREDWRRWLDTRNDATNRVDRTEIHLRLALASDRTNRPPDKATMSLDGRWVLTVNEGRRVAVWSAANGEPLETWDAPGRVEALAAGTNPVARFQCGDRVFERDLLPKWELQTTLGGTAQPLAFKDRVGALAYSPDGHWLASGSGEPSRSGDLAFWSPADGTWLAGMTNLHSDAVLSLAFSPDSRTLASTGADRFVRLVDPLGLRQIRALEGHSGHVLAAGWKDDGSTLATGSADLTVKFWDTVTGEKKKQAGGFEREVTGVVFLGGDQWVTTGSARELRVVNENGDRVRALTGPTDVVYALAISDDGRWMASGGEDGALRLWGREGDAPRVTFAPPSMAVAAGGR